MSRVASSRIPTRRSGRSFRVDRSSRSVGFFGGRYRNSGPLLLNRRQMLPGPRARQHSRSGLAGLPAGLFWGRRARRSRSMTGLFSGGSRPVTMQHVAFAVEVEDGSAAPQGLQSVRITPFGRRREPINEPTVFAWMPAASAFLDDPDGSLLEHISLHADPPRHRGKHVV